MKYITALDKGAFVIITKIDIAFNPLRPTASFDEYIPGAGEQGASLPVSFTMRGRLLKDIEVNGHIYLMRYERNGVKFGGKFGSSPIQSIEDNMIHTLNSVYSVTMDPNPDTAYSSVVASEQDIEEFL